MLSMLGIGNGPAIGYGKNPDGHLISPLFELLLLIFDVSTASDGECVIDCASRFPVTSNGYPVCIEDCSPLPPESAAQGDLRMSEGRAAAIEAEMEETLREAYFLKVLAEAAACESTSSAPGAMDLTFVLVDEIDYFLRQRRHHEEVSRLFTDPFAHELLRSVAGGQVLDSEDVRKTLFTMLLTMAQDGCLDEKTRTGQVAFLSLAAGIAATQNEIDELELILPGFLGQEDMLFLEDLLLDSIPAPEEADLLPRLTNSKAEQGG